MKTRLALFSILFLGCTTGNLGDNCNPDGTCNGPNLECSYKRCDVKTPPRQGRCFYESECFCVTCSEKCGDAGVKDCAYSDTSVWGSKPAVCSCK